MKNRIKEFRERAGLTQVGLADVLCVHVNSVSRWECGAREPSLEMAKRIAECLQVSLSDVFGTGATNPPLPRKVAARPRGSGVSRRIGKRARY